MNESIIRNQNYREKDHYLQLRNALLLSFTICGDTMTKFGSRNLGIDKAMSLDSFKNLSVLFN